MTTNTVTWTDRTSDSLSAWPLYAAISTGTAAVLTAIGTFWSPLADYEATATMDDFVSWLVVVGFIVVGAAIVFGLVVRRATPASARRRAIILAGLSVLSIVVFWTGLPMIFAGGAACCAMADRARVLSRTALALAGLVAVAAVWLALAG